LFSKQALRPYWTAIGILAAAVVALCVVGGILLHRSNERMIDAQSAIAELEKQLADEKAQSQQALAELKDVKQSLSSRPSRSGGSVSGRSASGLRNYSSTGRSASANNSMNSAIDAVTHGVYFIYTEGFDIRIPNGESTYLACGDDDVPAWTGTGFLLSDGCFVTARHVVDAWSFWLSGNTADESLIWFNLIMNNGGRVIAHFVATTSTGDSFRFTSDQMQFDTSFDTHDTDRNGNRISLADYDMPQMDYAYMMVGRPGPIVADPYLSRHLERMTELTILGFPFGIGASSRRVSPVYGNATVAVSGLQDGGILTTNTNYEHGNSGGPALARDASGNLVAVGIVSMSFGKNMGFIVPISEVCW
jgi:S1-C subfamily serine protease